MPAHRADRLVVTPLKTFHYRAVTFFPSNGQRCETWLPVGEYEIQDLEEISIGNYYTISNRVQAVRLRRVDSHGIWFIPPDLLPKENELVIE